MYNVLYQSTATTCLAFPFLISGSGELLSLHKGQGQQSFPLPFHKGQQFFLPPPNLVSFLLPFYLISGSSSSWGSATVLASFFGAGFCELLLELVFEDEAPWSASSRAPFSKELSWLPLAFLLGAGGAFHKGSPAWWWWWWWWQGREAISVVRMNFTCGSKSTSSSSKGRT